MSAPEPKIRWGILSTGNIANKMANALRILPDAEMVAVASRDQASADKFGTAFNIPRRYNNYQALADDPDVDIIYIGTPHAFHAENALMCLNAGKHVLCEKPFTLSARQAEAVVTLARQKKRFLMEAMWYRFQPCTRALIKALQDGVIGSAWMLSADFSYFTQYNPQHRLFNPNLGGGALLDVGVYPLTLAVLLWGWPVKVETQVHFAPTRVDDDTILRATHTEGRYSILTCATRHARVQEVVIAGTEGFIHVPAEYWRAQKFTVARLGETEQVIEAPLLGNGYAHQLIEAMRCIRAGEIESPLMTHADTLTMMHQLDSIRTEWGMPYPGE